MHTQRVLFILILAAAAGCGGAGQTTSLDAGSMGANDAATCAANQQLIDGECVTIDTRCTPENCNGCCADGVCVDGLANDANCGGSGQICSACGNGARCIFGVCELPCNSDNCAGCCDPNGVCQTGRENATCGTHGAACASCGDATCLDGVACLTSVTPNCAPGCFTIGTTSVDCHSGNEDDACGKDNHQCTACPNGYQCSSGECLPPSTARWDLVLLSGNYSRYDYDGTYFDILGMPDPYVEVVISGTTYQSSVQADTVTPVWNEVIATDLGSAEVAAMQVKLFEKDPVGAQFCDQGPIEWDFLVDVHTAPQNFTSNTRCRARFRVLPH